MDNNKYYEDEYKDEEYAMQNEEDDVCELIDEIIDKDVEKCLLSKNEGGEIQDKDEEEKICGPPYSSDLESIDIYNKEILDAYPKQYNKERCFELADIIKNGTHDKAVAARNELIESHLLLALKIAKYSRRSYSSVFKMSMEELVQEANLGLIKAADLYDPAFDCSFATYASNFIFGNVYAYYNYNNCNKILNNKRYIHRQFKKLKKLYEKLETEQKPITPENVAEGLKIRPATAQKLMYNYNLQLADIRTLRDNAMDYDGFYYQYAAPDADPADIIIKQEKSQILCDSIKKLNPLDQKIINLRFNFDGTHPMPNGGEMPYDAIGKILDITGVTVFNHLNRIKPQLAKILQKNNYFD